MIRQLIKLSKENSDDVQLYRVMADTERSRFVSEAALTINATPTGVHDIRNHHV